MHSRYKYRGIGYIVIVMRKHLDCLEEVNEWLHSKRKKEKSNNKEKHNEQK